MKKRDHNIFPHLFDFSPVYMIGIKGQGMTALAEILLFHGAKIKGSDISEQFYTDSILRCLKIFFYQGFKAEHITNDIKLVIHSTAYTRENNPEVRAAYKMGLNIMTYPVAIGQLSASFDFSGISGVHGKTTTTAMAGTILKYIDLPVTVLAGSQVLAFGNRSSLIKGDKYLIAETCEYKRHFLNYHPDRLIITSVEPDHLDYFKDIDDIYDAFETYAASLSKDGTLIYNADDKGASEIASRIMKRRSDIKFVPYGIRAQGKYKVNRISIEKGETLFSLNGFKDDFSIKLPGKHSVQNAAAALALVCDILEENRALGDNTKANTYSPDSSNEIISQLRKALADFSGCKRRCEILGNVSGILFIDDYAHHPTAIRKTLKGIKQYYPDKRIIVDFMSHTYSRTKALLKEFGLCFGSANMVILHRIYASAREKNKSDICGRDLFKEVSMHHGDVNYFDEPMETVDFLKAHLKTGDIFITMGAGDNWKLGEYIFNEFNKSSKIDK